MNEIRIKFYCGLHCFFNRKCWFPFFVSADAGAPATVAGGALHQFDGAAHLRVHAVEFLVRRLGVVSGAGGAASPAGALGVGVVVGGGGGVARRRRRTT